MINCEATENLTLRPAPNGLFDYVVPYLSKYRLKASAIDQPITFFVSSNSVAPSTVTKLSRTLANRWGLRGRDHESKIHAVKWHQK